MAIAMHTHTSMPDRHRTPDTSAGAGRQRPRVERIIIEQRRRYLAYLRRRLPSTEEAEDVFQNFCVRALLKAEQIRDTGTAEAWLQRVLFSVLQDFYRSKGADRRGRAELEQAVLVEEQMSPEQEEDKTEAHICACVYAHLPKMKPEYRTVLWRVDFLGERRQSVARSLDMNAGNMRVRLHRARKSLRSILETTCPTCAEGSAKTCHLASNCNARPARAS